MTAAVVLTPTAYTASDVGRARASGGRAAAGTRLAAVPHLTTFWFSWRAFHPDTRVER